MAIDLKKQTRRLIEDAYNNGKIEVIDELCDPEYQGVDPLVGKYDREGFKGVVQQYRAAFPDLKLEVVQSIVEGNLCVTRWKATGTQQGQLAELKPTGKRASTSGITITEFKGDKAVSDLTEWDAMGMFRQLGAEAAAPVSERTEGPAPEARH